MTVARLKDDSDARAALAAFWLIVLIALTVAVVRWDRMDREATAHQQHTAQEQPATRQQ